MTKLISMLLTLLLLGGCAIPAGNSAEESSEAPLYQAGEYRGSAKGYSDLLEVKVLLTDQHIDEIRVVSSPETKGIGAVAVEQIPGLIVANQSLQVDVVAGATITSRALLSAVQEALGEAEVDLAPLLAPVPQPITPALRAQVGQADLVIIGAGGAGLSAALAAAQKNPALRIVLLEKTALPGGNTKRAEDGINAAASAAQRKQEIEDDFEVMLADSLAAAGAKENNELLEVLAGDSAAALDWLAEQGLVLEEIVALPQSSAPRAHRPAEAATGEYLTEQLTAAVRSAGVEIFYRTEATAITTDPEGRISGVIAEAPGTRWLFTGKAVVLATGGFAANDKLCGSYRTLLRGLDTISSSAANGGGIAMAQELGAATIDMAQIVTEPTVHRGSAVGIPRALREDGAILIDHAGARFVEELGEDRVVSDAILSQPGRSAMLVFDQSGFSLLPTRLQQVVLFGDDPELLGKAMFPENPSAVEALLETIEETNAALPEVVDGAKNEQNPTRLGGKLYALPVAPGIKATLGGLMITPQAEVVGADGAPVLGLYAAGEVTGGVHGAAALPGNSLTELVVFGRRAGDEAARYATEEPPQENADPV